MGSLYPKNGALENQIKYPKIITITTINYWDSTMCEKLG